VLLLPRLMHSGRPCEPRHMHSLPAREQRVLPLLLHSSIFQPTPLDWLFGSGIGTNLGASLLWGCIGFFLGTRVKRHLDVLHAHNEWVAGVLTKLHRAHFDEEPPEHPRYRGRHA